MTSNSLLLMEPPHCKTCLDLSWARIPDDSCDEPRECRLKIPYQSLLNSKDCQICTVITYAITEFGKTLDAYDEKFYQFLQLSQVRIFLRDGWTTRVSLWRGEDLLPEPYLELEIFTIDDVPASIPAFRTANEIPPTLDLASCTRFLLPNIQTCDATHICCQPKSSQMPFRLLYVGSECGSTRLRLEIRPALQRYTALSHCWGDQSAIFATTKATLNDLLLEIPWGKLPKTFQDAVSITRSLNISYLWIDSLCIVQDDTSDWKAESVKMAEVYSGAYMTIAATGASSGNLGCFFDRWHETDFGARVSHATSRLHSDRISTAHGVKIRYSSKAHTHFVGNLHPPVSGAPLWNRAWAFQERILSKRLIHFHGEEMVWECRQSRDCECGYFSWNLGMNLPASNSALLADGDIARTNIGAEVSQTAFERWLECVYELTKLEITYELDRLPAISGIAASLCKHLNSSYTAGIWHYRLGQGLLWKKRPYQLSRRVDSVPDRCSPSWSWASVELLSRRSYGLHIYGNDLVIDKNFVFAGPASSEHEIKTILSAQDAILQITGLVIPCTMKHRHEVKSDIYPTHLLEFREQTELAYTDITCDVESVQDSVEVLCLLVGASSNERMVTWDASGSGPYILHYSLILQSDATGVYTRIGMSEHDTRKGWFHHGSVTTVEII